MSQQVDLNKLRQTILSSQNKKEALPADNDRKIMVTKEGKIVAGENTQGKSQKQLSEVHQGVFAQSRLEAEKKLSKKNFQTTHK